jgi:hypothetical protein
LISGGGFVKRSDFQTMAMPSLIGTAIPSVVRAALSPRFEVEKTMPRKARFYQIEPVVFSLLQIENLNQRIACTVIGPADNSGVLPGRQCHQDG